MSRQDSKRRTRLRLITIFIQQQFDKVFLVCMGVATTERRERAHPHQRRKLQKFEHVALNSASETFAKSIKMHRFASFLGLCPRPPYRGGATAPLPRPHFPQRSGALRLARLGRGLRPLHRPQPEILDPPLGAPTIWKSWLRLCNDTPNTLSGTT